MMSFERSRKAAQGLINMKAIPLLLIFLGFSHVYGQVDTIKLYYPDGQIQFTYPTLDGETHGVYHQYYRTGSVASEGEYSIGKMNGLHQHYYQTRELRMRYWYVDGKLVKSKYYRVGGEKELFEWTTKNGRKQKTWFINGTVAMIEKYSNGHPINCSVVVEEGNKPNPDTEICYCLTTQVYWKDNKYVDDKGNEVNVGYKYARLEYFENGKPKSKIKFKNNKKHHREWNENGQLVTDSLSGGMVETTYSVIGP